MRRTCDAAPVQYEGEVDGKVYYFRARYDRWAFGIADEFALAVDAAMGGCCGWHDSGDYDPTGDGWGASWMDHADAERIIRLCITNYRNAQP